MNKIIHQICKEFINEITKFVSGEEIKTLKEMEEGFKGISDIFLREIIKAYLEGIDKEIYEDKYSRKKEGLVVEKRNQERKIYTIFGELKYKRTYYKDKKLNEYIHPVDKVAGIEKYERVSLTVATELVKYASEVSYKKSSEYVTNGDISRQTVKNKLRKIGNLEIKKAKEKRQVRILHITADEDHVPLQDGRDTEVPLITVYEGLKYINKNRYKCINAKHFSNYEKKTEELWMEVNDWIYETYDEETLERIYIHGDGAKWIKTGIKYILKSKYVLDDYHENKAIMIATGAQPGYRKLIKTIIKDANKDEFKKATKELLKTAKSEKEKERIIQFRRYINNNWEGI